MEELEALVERRSRELSKRLEEFRSHRRKRLIKELERAMRSEEQTR